MDKTDTDSERISEVTLVRKFKDKTKALFHPIGGMSVDVIEDKVKNIVLDIARDYELNAEIKDVIISGSRCRGIEKPHSDLDVVVAYLGTEKEEDFSTLLHDELIRFEDVELDIIPINIEKEGRWTEYLSAQEALLSERQQHNIDITYTVAECGEFHSKGAFSEGITTLVEAKQLFESLTKTGNKKIPSIGIKINDIQIDVLYGKIIDLDNLRFFPQLWTNQDGLSKVSEIIDNFPKAKIIGQLPGLAVPNRTKNDNLVDTDAVKPVFKADPIHIAEDIAELERSASEESYDKTFPDPQEHIDNLVEDLKNGNIAYLLQYLHAFTLQEIGAERMMAETLIKRIQEYDLLRKSQIQNINATAEISEEGNYNSIDGIIGNSAPKEGRKEHRRINIREKIRENRIKLGLMKDPSEQAIEEHRNIQ